MTPIIDIDTEARRRVAEIEPGEELQLFLRGKGSCLWGFREPVVRSDGGIVITLDVTPLPQTVEDARKLGCRVHPTDRVQWTRGAMVSVPVTAIDVIFPGER